MRGRTLIVACALGLASSACASAKVPDAQVAPDQTIAAAQERSVDDHPEAKLHLKLARDQMEKAKKLREDGDKKEAQLMMLKAQADADYALALLRKKDQEADTAEIVAKLEKLREEMGTSEEQ